jgi:hypothetical protein
MCAKKLQPGDVAASGAARLVEPVNGVYVQFAGFNVEVTPGGST